MPESLIDRLRRVYRAALPLRLRESVRTAIPAIARYAGKPPEETKTDMRRFLARRYINGQGIEIGALHCPLPVEEFAIVKYVDRMSTADLRREYKEMANENLVNVDIVDDGETLATVADGSQDFVIACHFVEHSQDPIRTLGNMLRVLRPNGVLYIALPDKRFSFDRDRPITKLSHLLDDYRNGPEASRRAHVAEWVQYVDKIEIPYLAESRIQGLIDQNYSIHYHAWTQTEMLELVTALSSILYIPLDLEAFIKNAGECLFIVRKMG